MLPIPRIGQHDLDVTDIFISQGREDIKKHRTLHFGGNGGTLVKKSCLGVRNNILKIPPPPPVLSAVCPSNAPKISFFANISQSMKPREKLVPTDNVPREISYKIGHSRVSLCVLISLKIYWNGYKSRFLLFFSFLATFWRIFCDLKGLDEKL